MQQHLRAMPGFSPVIAGCMKWGEWGSKFSRAEYGNMIRHCLDHEVSTFDHADIYGHYTTEAAFGEVLREDPGLRAQMQIITKCGICMVTPNRPSHQIKHYNTSAEHIIRSAERSLQHLHTDHIDLLLIHRPDPLMDPHDIAEAFTSLKQAGKVLHTGVSNFNVSQLSMLHALYPVAVNQVEISLMHRDALYNGVLDQCIREGIVPQSWSPLGGGRIHADAEEEQGRKIHAMSQILAEKYSASFDQILLAWLMQHPSGIVPVIGTTRKDRIRDAMLARAIQLTREEWFMLLRAASGHEVP
jgi:predicted oxidoreductase